MLSYFWKVSNIELGQSSWSQFEEVNNQKLAYRFTPSSISGSVLGNILMIHGFAAWGKTWIDQEISLSTLWYNVYTIDLPPFGMTDIYPMEYFSREKQAELINGFIQKKWLNNIFLLAHSYGWKAAMEAYMQNQKSFSGLILLDVALWFPKSEEVFIQPTWLAGYIMTHKFPRDMLMRFVVTNTFIGTKALKSFIFDESSLNNERLAIYKTPFQVIAKSEYVWDWLSYITTHPESWLSTWAQNYQQIQIPTLIIWWKQDTITPLAQWQALHKMITWSELVVLDKVNHIPQIEDPIHVNEALVGFLTKHQ
jgi:pimeloyl-ACP methyl ester carboxylesterase